jgi:hypothetical protein
MPGLHGEQLRISAKNPCRVATISNVTNLSSGAPNVVDGVNVGVGDRILVRSQSTAAENGIYVVVTVGGGANGSWVRAGDFSDATDNEIKAGLTTYIQEGSLEGLVFTLTTTGAITLSSSVVGGEGYFQELILDKASTSGLKVDIASPTFGWRDLRGAISRDISAFAPVWNYYIGGIRQAQFLNSDEAFIEYHLPHDYAAGTDIYLHFHWSQTTVDTGGAASAPGDVRWNYELLYAKGHDQAAFPGTATTGFIVQTASGTVRQHMVAEKQISAASPAGDQVDTDILEPDGLFLARVWRDTTDAEDTLDQDPFCHEVDIHYQSTGMATKNKAPNFYGA